MLSGCADGTRAMHVYEGGHDDRQGRDDRSLLGIRGRDRHQYEPHPRVRLHRLPNQRMRADRT